MSLKIAGVGDSAAILMYNVTKIAGVGDSAVILMHNVTKIAGVGGRAPIIMHNVTKSFEACQNQFEGRVDFPRSSLRKTQWTQETKDSSEKRPLSSLVSI
ncbi:hypothetical protein J41TS12_28700 [Paenibacillus antibioticophila]|uniref:Uncharacterized protein n=1 Tax=Paenibacillus antibioticophila TaxID=1274374 RepID=A0A919XU31_9BACL|nr:hypothetical protein [Paenibacillus antibioticophila]GIO38009.1 hypothetical protein J41TS12_28700 [Paenibacillus antibioticophila]